MQSTPWVALMLAGLAVTALSMSLSSIDSDDCAGIALRACSNVSTRFEAEACIAKHAANIASVCGAEVAETLALSLAFPPRALADGDSLLAPFQPRAASSAASSQESILDLFIFPPQVVDQFGARCLDGTPAGYYVSRAPADSPNANNWVIFLEGGGLCLDFFSCHLRTKNHLGSSKFWSKTMQDDMHVYSSNEAVNPTFHDFNRVFVPYCTGDVWSGTENKTNWMGLTFAGHNVIRAVIDQLNLTSASRLLLTGQSAGGIGTMLHADYLSTVLPRTAVKAAPEAGFFFPGNVTLYEEYVAHLNTPIAPLASRYLTLLFSSFTDESCRSERRTDRPYLCWDAAYSYPHIETPLFLAQNRFDSCQMQFLLVPKHAKHEDGFLAMYGKEALQDMAAVGGQNGVFMPSCLKHTGNLCIGSHTEVQGLRLVDVLGDWWDSVGKVSHWVLDHCQGDLPCNPSCNDHCG